MLLEEKVEAKLKFSKFLDEVTSNVLDPNRLHAFSKPVPVCSLNTRIPNKPEGEIQEGTEWDPGMLCSMAQQQGSLLELKMSKEEQPPAELAQKAYLEMDIDTVRRDGKSREMQVNIEPQLQPEIDEKHVIPPLTQFCEGFEIKSPFLEFHCHLPRYPYKSASLPRGINMVSDESLPSL